MTIRVANAPCSWGVLEFDDLAGETADCEQFLTELKRAGYEGTELGDWGFMPTDPVELRDLLAGYALPLLGGFVPVDLTEPEAHEPGAELAVRTAKLMRAANPDAFIVLSDENGKDPVRTLRAGRIVGGPYDLMGREDALSDNYWGFLIRGAQYVARRVLEETGLRTVFHHHCAGWVETPAEVERLMDETDPDLLGLCFDTGHWAFGGARYSFANGVELDGADLVEALQRHWGRVWHVHFKDHDPDVHKRSIREEFGYFESVRQGVFCELGQGDVDFEGVVDTLRRNEYDGWVVVEQDVLPGMGSPLESATRNRNFLYELGL